MAICYMATCKDCICYDFCEARITANWRERSMIGKTVNGYAIVGNINNLVVIAHNPKAVEPWVVWNLDSDGDPYSGSYFSSREAAVREFCERAFCYALS